MGVESGSLSNNMITVSSSFAERFNAADVSLNSRTAWVPFTASTNQWIQVNGVSDVTVVPPRITRRRFVGGFYGAEGRDRYRDQRYAQFVRRNGRSVDGSVQSSVRQRRNELEQNIGFERGRTGTGYTV